MGDAETRERDIQGKDLSMILAIAMIGFFALVIGFYLWRLAALVEIADDETNIQD